MLLKSIDINLNVCTFLILITITSKFGVDSEGTGKTNG